MTTLLLFVVGDALLLALGIWPLPLPVDIAVAWLAASLIFGGLYSLYRKARPTPFRDAREVNAYAFRQADITIICPLCRRVDSERPFSRSAISCYRDDCKP